jgi:hypothetical protein
MKNLYIIHVFRKDDRVGVVLGLGEYDGFSIEPFVAQKDVS